MPDTLNDALDLVAAEAMRRLENGADDIPNHVLFKMFTDLNKVIERREEADEEESKPFNLIDEIPTMPKEHARDLIRAEISRLETERLELIGVLESLDKEEVNA